MEGTFNQNGTSDYVLTISEKEFLYLQKGTTTVGDILSHWQAEVVNNQINISLQSREYLEKLKKRIKSDSSLGTFHQFMWKVVLVRKDNEVYLYYNNNYGLPTPYEVVSGKVSETRYCDSSFAKVIILIKND